MTFLAIIFKTLPQHLIMGYLERLFASASPLDFVRDSFIHIHAWLLERKVDPDEAGLLGNMTRKVDWSDHFEKKEFVRLMEYFSERSSTSEELSWAAVVGLDWIWPHHSCWLFSRLEIYSFALVFLIKYQWRRTLADGSACSSSRLEATNTFARLTKTISRTASILPGSTRMSNIINTLLTLSLMSLTWTVMTICGSRLRNLQGTCTA